MAKYAMLIDPSRCTGCAACGIACQLQWQLPKEMHYNHLEFAEKGKYPEAWLEILPVQCQHCEDAPCLKHCPTDATYRREDGIVDVDPEECIECQICVQACPYDVRVVNQETGVPEKCKFCSDFVDQGETPACVSTCMNEVRIFGDLDDPDSEISKAMAKEDTYQLLAEEGTEPRVYYVLKGEKIEFSGK
ncbi:4Fe-4S dicluster domain-containing protein [Fuchsiella alkaliacetigena]|uniref:4Fe-4S dicluster domain-containing protein n=1 Tax=Fuchsiella alkaliacetigena TaxID=957042 RepID=UPI002009E650|nr:4Fe-4S dicluster domain-containing protein [Fuchsiella alkaliacetigena]MCK8825469.1 4Fe-4S dicluster domain-containing protein [Fuchsiella alkaliacetigena]